MKTYVRHYCERNHRSIRAVAKCLWPRAAWIRGDGPFALLAHCRHLTVTLHPTIEAAMTAKQHVDAHGCGGRCDGDHEVIEIAVPIQTRAQPKSPAAPDKKLHSKDAVYAKQRSRLKLKK